MSYSSIENIFYNILIVVIGSCEKDQNQQCICLASNTFWLPYPVCDTQLWHPAHCFYGRCKTLKSSQKYL